MKENIFIAIDSGKYATKAIMEYKGKISTMLFRTKLQEVIDVGMDIQPNSFKAEYEGKQYLLGDMVSEAQSDFNLSKELLIHKIAIYTVIVEMMKNANVLFHHVHLHLAVNAPINVYKSKSLKDSYKRFIENSGKTIYLQLNDILYNFNLNEVTVCFEGMGLTYTNSLERQVSSSAVLDIGGLNTTYCLFNGIQPDFNSMTVSHLGMNTLKAKLEQELVQRYNRNISANDLEQIIQKGYFSYMGQIDEDSRSVIGDIKASHFEQIINYAKQHNYTFNQDKIYFAGGGSLLLQKEIQKSFPQASILINPQFANVKSFLEIIKVKFQ